MTFDYWGMHERTGMIKQMRLIAASMVCLCVVDISRASSVPDREGFLPLFNGADLTGWEYLGKSPLWGVKPDEPEVLQFIPEWLDEKTVVWGCSEQLWTSREYTNFVLRFDFMMPTNGNNGVGIRMLPLKDAAYYGFCEVQLLDDGGPAYFDADANKDICQPVQFCGSVYGVLPSRRDNSDRLHSSGCRSYVRKPGEWNGAEILVADSFIRVVLNGVVVTEGDVSVFKGDGDTPDGKLHPGLRRRSGPIGLLGYKGHNVKFRNLRVKELK